MTGSTGIHREGNKIYAVVSKPAAVWVQRSDGHVERWARLKPTSGCAG